jgi:hypothetical protein
MHKGMKGRKVGHPVMRCVCCVFVCVCMCVCVCVCVYLCTCARCDKMAKS